jgi:SAM-dependent MidA family methyltransferase
VTGPWSGLRRVPEPDLEAVGQDEQLVIRIRDEILAGGPITFARFMELALYDPEGGYYRSATPRPGRAGDFLTAPEAHPLFGWALARQVHELWDLMGRPAPFVIREPGAGTGVLGTAILEGLAREGSGLAQAVRYEPVEVDPRRIEAVRERLALAGFADRLAVPGERPISGLILANEVLDALPVHRVEMHGGRLQEILVGWNEDGFADVRAEPTTPALAQRLAEEDIVLAEGQRAEISLALDEWVRTAAGWLERGLLLLIDYGYPAQELYAAGRFGGTLRAYVRHRVHDDPYRHVGRQDLTAHVDVTAVTRAAERAGLSSLGVTTQAELLASLEAGELLVSLQSDPGTSLHGYLEARSALLRMLDPAAMGRFRVMAFGRALPAGTVLRGFMLRLPNRDR